MARGVSHADLAQLVFALTLPLEHRLYLHLSCDPHLLLS